MKYIKKVINRSTKLGLSFLAAALVAYGQENTKTLANSVQTQSGVYLRDQEILAKIILGEARNCHWEEQVAVAYTAINRLNDANKRYGKSLEHIAKAHYDSFKFTNPNRKVIENPNQFDFESYKRIEGIARGVLAGKYQDITNGATHFHLVGSKPYWSKHPKMKRIGRIRTQKGPTKHVFYKEK